MIWKYLLVYMLGGAVGFLMAAICMVGARR